MSRPTAPGHRAERRVALVTGSSRNIGREIALALARSGHDVLVHGRAMTSDLARSAELVRACGVESVALVADLAADGGAEVLADAASREAPRVDVFVHNAVVRHRQPFERITPSELERTMRVNFLSAFTLCQRLLPSMMERAWGRVVNVIGVRGQTGAAERVHLTCSKSALVGLTRGLAHEYGRHGITVNAVSPGTTQLASEGDHDARIVHGVGLGARGRAGAPEEIAAAVAFLASDGAANILGQVIGVNGGELMAGG